MGCRCDERRGDLGRAAKAAVTGDLKTAGAAVGNLGRSLTDDAKAFARGLQARLRRR